MIPVVRDLLKDSNNWSSVENSSSNSFITSLKPVYNCSESLSSGVIQVLHNAVGCGVLDFPEKSFSEMYGSTLLAFCTRGGWGVKFQWEIMLRNN